MLENSFKPQILFSLESNRMLILMPIDKQIDKNEWKWRIENETYYSTRIFDKDGITHHHVKIELGKSMTILYDNFKEEVVSVSYCDTCINTEKSVINYTKH